MRRSRFGSSGPLVSAVGQGTFLMEHDEPRAVVEALQAGLDLGMNHIDTAELYGAGRVEELVGEALRGRREQAFLVSKVLPHNATHAGTVLACEQSLRRLQTEYLDAYLLHWPSTHPLEGTLEAMVTLRDAGKIRAFGVSNFDDVELGHAIAIAGRDAIACNQVLYHCADRSMEHALLPFAEAHGVTVVGYIPFGRRTAFPPRQGGSTLSDVARRLGRTERQVALAFLTRRPSLLAIPKASRIEHVRENAESLTLELSPADEAALESAFPLPARQRGISRV